MKFPKDFYWGAATSAYQVEGGINNCDWAEVYPAGIACDHYNRFEEDFDIAKSLGHNAHRFSIEWSRIEPEEGKFNEAEIEHYQKVIDALRQRGIEPFVTLWHWTNPIWFSEKGGWLNKDAPKYFERYVKKIVSGFGDDVKFWITLNEPDDVYAFRAYFRGMYPPQEKNFLKIWRVSKNLIEAHNKAYKIIHEHNNDSMVGFANNTIYFESRGLIAGIVKFFASKYWNFWFLDKVSDCSDFIGCSYYHHNILKGFKIKQNENKDTTDVVWEIYPEGIYHILKDLKKYKKPIYITENGLADAKDEKRAKFIKDHLFWTHKAIQEGVDVRGYFYWSLLDNFEWDKGFWPRFGLVEVDYKTMARKVRPSALEYKKIIESNSL